MSRYAVDLERRLLVVSWATGFGDAATTVAPVPEQIDDRDLLHLADTLTFLASAAWQTYTHPASAAPDLKVNGEGWRRDGERKAFASALTALETPNLPERGMILQSYVIVEEAAHRAGRALHAIGDPNLTSRVVDDVRSELDAVEQAERGDLRGRARQAVALARADASPLQIAAADAVLHDDPFGDDRLFTEIDPTAAAVAAARWLHAAARVTADVWGGDPTEVVLEADNIEALPHETPTLVLERIASGETPRAVVVDLVAEALEVADGDIPDIERLVEEVEEADARADALVEVHGEEIRAELMPRRLTPLDPRRPARDLLEDLLTGIRGCWLLYREYADHSAEDHLDDDSLADELDDDAILAANVRITAEFKSRVRDTADEDPNPSV